MSNGDSLDGFVFPPFIPTAAARPAEPAAPPAPAPVAEEPRAEPQSGAPRATMPWDVETPIVRESADVVPEPAAVEAEDEDLPWLERPEPREPVAEAPAAPAAEAAPAQDEAFPDWLAWDDRDTDEARSEAAGVAPVEGLEDFVPADDLGGVIAAPPAVEWAEAAPEPAQADAAESSTWSLDAPEAVEPPILAESAAELTFDSPEAAADAEPAFDVTLDDGAFTFAAAEADEAVAEAPPAAPFVVDEEAMISFEPDPFTSAAVDEAEAAAPVDAAVMSAGTSANGVFTDVAARLEDIARTLRERPDDLLSGSASDPLALLVAGYVMGYGARR
jgi:ribonuclease E